MGWEWSPGTPSCRRVLDGPGEQLRTADRPEVDDLPVDADRRGAPDAVLEALRLDRVDVVGVRARVEARLPRRQGVPADAGGLREAPELGVREALPFPCRLVREHLVAELLEPSGIGCTERAVGRPRRAVVLEVVIEEVLHVVDQRDLPRLRKTVNGRAEGALEARARWALVVEVEVHRWRSGSGGHVREPPEARAERAHPGRQRVGATGGVLLVGRPGPDDAPHDGDD